MEEGSYINSNSDVHLILFKINVNRIRQHWFRFGPLQFTLQIWREMKLNE